MLAFTKFSEDPDARFGTVMIDESRIESCTISEHKMARGAVANTLTIVMQSGTTHVVYGGMSDYLKIENSISFEPASAASDVTGFEVSDFLSKEIARHEQHTDESLSTDYKKGFVNGLIHARRTVSDMQQAMGIDAEE